MPEADIRQAYDVHFVSRSLFYTEGPHNSERERWGHSGYSVDRFARGQVMMMMMTMMIKGPDLGRVTVMCSSSVRSRPSHSHDICAVNDV